MWLMIIVKSAILMLIFCISVFLGLALADRYKGRVADLKNMRNSLNILETKIKYTYEPLPQIFEDISKSFDSRISNIFKTAKEKIQELSAGEAWRFAIENSKTNMNLEDLSILKNLDKLLGKTNVEGQLSEIELLKKFIDTQIKKAEAEQMKNEKLYQHLGVIVGLTIVTIFI